MTKKKKSSFCLCDIAENSTLVFKKNTNYDNKLRGYKLNF